MNLKRCLLVTAPAGSLVLGVVACSDGRVLGVVEPDAALAAPPAADPSEDDVPSTEDAGSSDDASADSDAAVAGPSCTHEGWCHTVVPGGQTLKSVWGDGHGVVWAVSEEGNVLRWDGAAWVQSHAAGVPLHAIWGSGPTDLWAGGGVTSKNNVAMPGVLLHGTGSSPSSISWTHVSAPVTIRSIWGTSANDVYAAASVTNRVDATDPSFVLHYSESEWTIDSVSTAFPAHFERVWGTSRDDIWVAGRVPVSPYFVNGQVLHRRPDGAGGFTWTKELSSMTGSTTVDVFGFSASSNATFLIGFTSDYNGPYYHTGTSNDEGASFTWTPYRGALTGFTQNALSTLWATGPDDVWLAGQQGRLRHWNGTEWHVAAVALDKWPVQNAVHAIWGSGSNDIWVVGADIALHKVAP